MKEQLNNFVEQLTADKKKLGLIVVLVAVGLLMWGRLLLKQVPQTASANDGPEVAVETGNSSDALDTKRSLVSLDIPQSLQRDLFLLDPSRYSPTSNKNDDDDDQKSLSLSTDESLQTAVVNAARGLQLQSVTLGDVPAAFINGRLVRVNGEIDGFKLLHCDERSAVLIRQGIKVRIKI